MQDPPPTQDLFIFILIVITIVIDDQSPLQPS
jgi:hypothetical protein